MMTPWSQHLPQPGAKRAPPTREPRDTRANPPEPHAGPHELRMIQYGPFCWSVPNPTVTTGCVGGGGHRVECSRRFSAGGRLQKRQRTYVHGMVRAPGKHVAAVRCDKVCEVSLEKDLRLDGGGHGTVA